MTITLLVAGPNANNTATTIYIAYTEMWTNAKWVEVVWMPIVRRLSECYIQWKKLDLFRFDEIKDRNCCILMWYVVLNCLYPTLERIFFMNGVVHWITHEKYYKNPYLTQIFKKPLVAFCKKVLYWISYKKISGDACLSPSWVEIWGLKDWYVSNIILYWKRKVDSLLGWTLPKLPIISKNAPNKSCWALNFV